MVKLIGLILIATGLFSLALGTFLDINHGGGSSVTGNAVAGIISQSPVQVNFVDYLGGIAFSYSIISMVAGAVFLFRV